MRKKYLRLIAGVCVALLMGLPATGRTRKGDRYLKQAQAAENKKDWDLALQLYMQALDEDPRDSGYVIGLQRVRFQAAAMHVQRGQRSREQGNLQDAINEFQRAVAADPSSPVALQELKRTQEMLRQPAASSGGRTLTPAEQVRKQEAEQVESMLGPPELKPALSRIPPIKLNNQPPRGAVEYAVQVVGAQHQA